MSQHPFEPATPLASHFTRRLVPGYARPASSRPAWVVLLLSVCTVSCHSTAGSEERTSTMAQALSPNSAETQLAAGEFHNCILVPDGTVQCWGDNSFGEMGQGSFGAGPNGNGLWPPTVVPNVTGVTAVASGSAHTCALNTNGTVQCWGNNAHGQLGNGTGGGSSSTPSAVTVSTLSNAIAISA